MQLKNYYWYFQKAVPEKICDEIVRYAKSIKELNKKKIHLT